MGKKNKLHVDLGDTARCAITGYEGMVIGIAHYLTGCSQALLKPTSLDKDGAPKEGTWMDVERLVRTGTGPELPHLQERIDQGKGGGPLTDAAPAAK